MGEDCKPANSRERIPTNLKLPGNLIAILSVSLIAHGFSPKLGSTALEVRLGNAA